MDRPSGNVAILDHAAGLLAGYDVLFCDVWGVLHNGARAHTAAGDALANHRKKGGVVVLVSNAPVPASSVAALLDRRQVRRDAWDGIVCSGDLTRTRLSERAVRRVHHIGPDRDLSLFRGPEIERVPLERAEAIVCTGVVDDARETGESYRPQLEVARQRNLALICANPDLAVEVAGTILPCAGAIALIYEEMGGEVDWAGKPYAIAYEAAQRQAEKFTGRTIPRSRILAIGDAMRTDIAGADAYGVDSLFVAHGIHRDELMPDGRLDPARLAPFFDASPIRPKAVMTELAW